MKHSEMKILQILLLELMTSCLEDDTDNCTLTMSNDKCDIIADITFAVRRKE